GGGPEPGPGGCAGVGADAPVAGREDAAEAAGALDFPPCRAAMRRWRGRVADVTEGAARRQTAASPPPPLRGPPPHGMGRKEETHLPPPPGFALAGSTTLPGTGRENSV